jgi:hypothetical protein
MTWNHPRTSGGNLEEQGKAKTKAAQRRNENVHIGLKA